MHKRFYLQNRAELIDSIKDDVFVIVLGSGQEVVRSADENYDFQVNNNFYYLTGIKQPNSYLVIMCDEYEYCACLYIDEYDENYEKWLGHRLTRKEASDISGICQSNIFYTNEFQQGIEEIFKEIKNIYLDFDNKHFSLNEKIKTLSSKQNDYIIKDIYNNIIKLRMAKKPCEIRTIKKAIENTNSGLINIMNHAKVNMYEYQLESYFDFVIKNVGQKELSFKTIAASGINATTLHYSENNSLLKDNDLILFDLGCKEEGYCADISRTYPINGKFTSLQKKIYNIVLKTNQKICKVAKAGMTLKELQQIAKDCLAEGCLKAKLIKNKAEIDKYYFHSVSHSIGLDTHDPYIKEIPLPVNAIISNEPGLYFKELGIGIRIEDDLLIKQNKAINLSKQIIKSINDIEKFMSKSNKEENL